MHKIAEECYVSRMQWNTAIQHAQVSSRSRDKEFGSQADRCQVYARYMRNQSHVKKTDRDAAHGLLGRHKPFLIYKALHQQSDNPVCCPAYIRGHMARHLRSSNL